MIRHLTNLKISNIQQAGITAAKYSIKGINNGVFSQEAFSILLIAAGQLGLKIHGIEHLLSTGHLLYLPAGSSGQVFCSASSFVIYNYLFTKEYWRANILNTQQALVFERQLRHEVKLLKLDEQTYRAIEALYRPDTLPATFGLSTKGIMTLDHPFTSGCNS
jgi:glyoxylate utilization-related uncharacterized protein